MSDCSEELLRSNSEDDNSGDRRVLSGSGMCFPWLQRHVESVEREMETEIEMLMRDTSTGRLQHTSQTGTKPTTQVLSIKISSGLRHAWSVRKVSSHSDGSRYINNGWILSDRPPTRGKKEKDFAQTTSACLSVIQEALLKHQWQRAAEYMHSYLQILEDLDSRKRQGAPEIIWKLGSEILYYHPKSSVEAFNTFADRMKNIGVMNYLKISLQHALYLLHHGMLDEADRNLSQAEAWRYGDKSSSQELLINLIQAYKGLLQYYTWSKKKVELSQLDEEDYAYNTASQSMLSQSWKTSVNFCALIQVPGVWDPFVKSYVEMLEFYGDQDGALEVLSNYAYDKKFPSNPNAHVYLYNFLKREKAPREKLINALKILYQIVPSHNLMLEFHRLLRKSDKEEHHKLALEVLFRVLDFSGCTKNITAWKYLAKYLQQTLMGNHVTWVHEEWKSRKNWWPGFHFSYFWAKSDWKEDKALADEKAFVAGMLLGKGCKYFRYISKQDHQVLRKKIKQMKKLVKKYSIVNSRL